MCVWIVQKRVKVSIFKRNGNDFEGIVWPYNSDNCCSRTAVALPGIRESWNINSLNLMLDTAQDNWPRIGLMERTVDCQSVCGGTFLTLPSLRWNKSGAEQTFWKKLERQWAPHLNVFNACKWVLYCILTLFLKKILVGLLFDSVSSIQTSTPICARYGPRRYAAAPCMVTTIQFSRVFSYDTSMDTNAIQVSTIKIDMSIGCPLHPAVGEIMETSSW